MSVSSEAVVKKFSQHQAVDTSYVVPAQICLYSPPQTCQRNHCSQTVPKANKVPCRLSLVFPNKQRNPSSNPPLPNSTEQNQNKRFNTRQVLSKPPTHSTTTTTTTTTTATRLVLPMPQMPSKTTTPSKATTPNHSNVSNDHAPPPPPLPNL